MEFQWRMEKLPGVMEVDLKGAAGAARYELRNLLRCAGRGLAADVQICMDEFFEEEEQKSVTGLLVEAAMQGGYYFGKDALKACRSDGIYRHRDALSRCREHCIYLISRMELTEEIKDAQMLGRCSGYARMLGDLPGNYLHAEEFLAYAKEMSAALPITLEVYGNEKLKEMNCGGILAVNQASDREANLIVLHYEGNPKASHTAIVGKGILFDSGGYHLKSIEGMEGMKYDMCGAADVLCLLEYLAQRQKKVNVTAVIPIAENVISPDGVKMGDVLLTMSGKTVEVYNTDAEGRLLLCDALTFACCRIKADTVLDFATLTYSCKNALGDEIAGVFSNNDGLYQKIEHCAKASGEKVWRLPLDETYHKQLQWSKTADIANYAPGKGAGAGIAACFLEEFIEDGVNWAHFDMVGPASAAADSQQSESGATGCMMSTAAAILTKKDNNI